MSESRSGSDDSGGIVVVPERPGPVVRLDVQGSRNRDELDELIDDFFPDSDERPGWFDVGLLVVGLVLLGWAAIGGGPAIALVVGLIAAGLGCILPARSAWRRVERVRRARRRAAVMAHGVPMRLTDSTVDRLVRAYDGLVATASAAGARDGPPAVAAGHSALMEAASLLRGRIPDSADVRDYIDKRSVAIEDLTAALREQRETKDSAATDVEVYDGSAGPELAAVLRARQELDVVDGFNSLRRLEELTAAVRAQHGNG